MSLCLSGLNNVYALRQSIPVEEGLSEIDMKYILVLLLYLIVLGLGIVL